MTTFSIAKDIYDNIYDEIIPNQICGRMGWKVEEDNDFWYVNLPNEDRPIFEFIFNSDF